MKIQFSVAVMCLTIQACTAGPHLGKPTDIHITESGVDDKRDTQLCGDFKLTPAQARRFLDRAVIVTPPEIHDSYSYLGCFVRGTAAFRGTPATWEIRAGGTARVTLLGEWTYELVDESQRESPE